MMSDKYCNIGNDSIMSIKESLVSVRVVDETDMVFFHGSSATVILEFTIPNRNRAASWKFRNDAEKLILSDFTEENGSRRIRIESSGFSYSSGRDVDEKMKYIGNRDVYGEIGRAKNMAIDESLSFIIDGMHPKNGLQESLEKKDFVILL